MQIRTKFSILESKHRYKGMGRITNECSLETWWRGGWSPQENENNGKIWRELLCLPNLQKMKLILFDLYIISIRIQSLESNYPAKIWLSWPLLASNYLTNVLMSFLRCLVDSHQLFSARALNTNIIRYWLNST